MSRTSKNKRKKQFYHQHHQQQPRKSADGRNYSLPQKFVSCLLLFVFFIVGSITNYKNLHFIKSRYYNDDGINSILQDSAAAAAATFSTTTIASGQQQRKQQQFPPLSQLTRGHITNIKCLQPLVPIYDRIVYDDSIDGHHNNDITHQGQGKQRQHQKIPKSIHMAWIRGYVIPPTESRCISQDMEEIVTRWKDQFPSYNFYFHDDYAVDYIIEDMDWSHEFPQLTKIMNSCVKFGSAMRIDIWRILVLYRYGGFYSDFDNAPGPNLTETTVQLDDTAFFLTAPWNRPSQWLMGMEPNHPILYFTILEIMKSLVEMDDISRPRVVFTTGPDALQRGYIKAISTGNNVGDEPMSHVLDPGVHKTRIEIFNGDDGDSANNLSQQQEQKIVRKLPLKDKGKDAYIWTNRHDEVPLDRNSGSKSDTNTNITLVSKQERIAKEMNTTHWKQFIRLNQKNVSSGRCSDHLYRNDQQHQ